LAKKLSAKIGTAFPYDWSNPDINPDVFIFAVLERGIFKDILLTTKYFGVDRVEAILNRNLEDIPAVTLRSFENLKKGVESSTQQVENIPLKSKPDNYELLVEKVLILEKRQYFSDLLELYHLIVSNGYTLREVYDVVESRSNFQSIEFIKTVLTGSIPADQKEEIDSNGIQIPVEDLYSFFLEMHDLYEQEISREIFYGNSL